MSSMVAYAGIFSSLISALLVHFLHKRKNDAEAKNLDIGNVQAIVDLWKEAAEDMTAQVKNFRAQVEILKEENSKLRGEIKELREENKKLRQEVSELKMVISQNQK